MDSFKCKLANADLRMAHARANVKTAERRSGCLESFRISLKNDWVRALFRKTDSTADIS